MVIEINDKIQISSDVNGWAIQKAVNRKNKTSGETEIEWQSFKWFASLRGAVTGLGNYQVQTADTLEEAMERLNEIAGKLEKRLDVMEMLVK